MDKKDLQVFSMCIISESKSSKLAKLQLLNFVMEASEHQLMAFILDGQIIKTDELSEQIIKDRFESHPLSEGVWKTLFGVFLLGGGGWVLYRSIRAGLSQKSRQCGVLGVGRERDTYLWKAKADEAVKMAGLISREMKNCTQAKNPEKCKKVGMKQIAQNKAKAAKYMQKIKNYGRKSIKKGAKAQSGVEKAADKSTKVF